MPLLPPHDEEAHLEADARWRDAWRVRLDGGDASAVGAGGENEAGDAALRLVGVVADAGAGVGSGDGVARPDGLEVVEEVDVAAAVVGVDGAEADGVLAQVVELMRGAGAGGDAEVGCSLGHR